MATLPLKLITKLNDSDKELAILGNYKLKQIKYGNRVTKQLLHYDVRILTIVYENDRVIYVCIPKEAYSVSDRDAINSLLMLNGINDKVHKKRVDILFEDGSNLKTY